VLVSPRCIDDAIQALERFAPGNPEAMSDLAAAYYLRAQREDRATDLLMALDTAQTAVDAAPRLIPARFNLALAQEAIGLSSEALANWRTLAAQDATAWRGEARQHANAIERRESQDAAQRWEITKKLLPGALAAGDRVAIARLITPFPAKGERYLERIVLHDWAIKPTPGKFAQARLLGAELFRRTNDPYVNDLLEASERASTSPQLMAALLSGYKLLDVSPKDQDEAVSLCAGAKAAFRNAGSPLYLWPLIQEASAIFFQPNDGAGRALALLDPIRKDLRAHHSSYRRVAIEIESMRAFVLGPSGRLLETLEGYDFGLQCAEDLRDRDQIGNMQAHRVGILNELGQRELAWREAVAASPVLPDIIETDPRHLLIGETAIAAAALGHPRAALNLENAGVAMLRDELKTLSPADARRRQRLFLNLGIALRARAGYEVILNAYDNARRDLDDSQHLAMNEEQTGDQKAGEPKKREGSDIQRALDTRIAQVNGQSQLATRPADAVLFFTHALELSGQNQSQSFRSTLYTERATAFRATGNRAAAIADLRSALHELQLEESQQLAARKPGELEPVWAGYFSRFEDTYRLLIQLLAEDGRAEEAFEIAEQWRAKEPLDLIRHLGTAPLGFRTLPQSGKGVLARIQQRLPAGTFLIEYTVLADRTYAWIVSRDSFRLLRQSATSAKIERWSETLQRAANGNRGADFEAGLYAPFAELIHEPLDAIHSMRDGKNPSLVFIPDGAMHGLPFAALRNPSSKHYLIEDAPVSIAGSATLFLYSLARDRQLSSAGAKPTILLVGDPKFDDTSPLTHGFVRLRGAVEEAKGIAAQYGSAATMLVADDATVPAFFSLARNSTIVHLALHSIVNPVEPTHSTLVFASRGSDSGLLEAGELVKRLKLDRTRLFILSSCSSAGGAPVGPEGVAPLVRPLIGAGVPAVIGSLWDVYDATAEQLLVSFHRHLRQGSNAAVALQLAQCELLVNKNPGYRSVLAWAPFQVIGYTSSPYQASRPQGRNTS
jgi:CHAT domain-containing protein/tetratricopeptide (TPR) repeat protein